MKREQINLTLYTGNILIKPANWRETNDGRQAPLYDAIVICIYALWYYPQIHTLQPLHTHIKMFSKQWYKQTLFDVLLIPRKPSMVSTNPHINIKTESQPHTRTHTHTWQCAKNTQTLKIEFIQYKCEKCDGNIEMFDIALFALCLFARIAKVSVICSDNLDSSSPANNVQFS